MDKPGLGRTVPLCPYFTKCGGCQFQHLDISSQLAAKSSFLRDALHRPVEVVPAPDPWGYRQHITFAVRGETCGLTSLSNEVLPVESCALFCSTVSPDPLSVDLQTQGRVNTAVIFTVLRRHLSKLTHDAPGSQGSLRIYKAHNLADPSIPRISSSFVREPSSSHRTSSPLELVVAFSLASRDLPVPAVATAPSKNIDEKSLPFRQNPASFYNPDGGKLQRAAWAREVLTDSRLTSAGVRITGLGLKSGGGDEEMYGNPELNINICGLNMRYPVFGFMQVN
jgi:hypothetical protein